MRTAKIGPDLRLGPKGLAWILSYSVKIRKIHFVIFRKDLQTKGFDSYPELSPPPEQKLVGR